MIDETNGPQEPRDWDTSRKDAERVGFCQDCGKPLTRETVKTVGSGVFCEPCLLARLSGVPSPGASAAAGAGGYSAGAANVPPAAGTSGAADASGPAGYSSGYAGGYATSYNTYTPRPRGPHEPSPALAGLLGVIPGVGAMYNGQMAKGVAHLVVFAVLMALSKNVSDVFSLFVLAWIAYQIFDAYHTARARRDGTPLPDPFGFNDIGERMGLGKNWGVVGHVRPQAPAAGPAAPDAQQASAAYAAPAAYPPPSAVPPVYSAPAPPVVPPPMPASDWVGYVPPTQFGAGAVPPQQYATSYDTRAYAENVAAKVQAQVHEQVARDMGVPLTAATGYAETFTGAGTADAAPFSAAPYADLPPTTKRFPVGAIWLIAIGALFLIGNFTPLRMNGSALAAVLLAALGSWLLVRRLGYAGGTRYGSVLSALPGPVFLLTLAVVLGLQAVQVATFGQTFGLLLLVPGLVLVAERAASHVHPGDYAMPPRNSASFVPPVPGAPSGSSTNDPGKGGY